MAEPAEVAASLPSLEEARGWVGHRIDEVGGSSFARVQGLYADSESGQPAWVVAKLGRFGRVTVVPFLDCAAAAGHVWVPYPRQLLRGAPVIDPSRPLTREQELAICEHYGLHEEIGRAGQVAGREEGAVTSRPAAAAA
jgi:hypothetical protein